MINYKEEEKRIVMNTLGVSNEEILGHLMLIEQMLHTIGYRSGIKFEPDLITKALKENFEKIERQKKRAK
jgi:hypothetical protein